MTDVLDELSATWLECKKNERVAIAERRATEDRIKLLVGIAENFEGMETAEADGFTIKIEGRINRKVDSEKLQELAVEAGLTDHIQYLFRWVPEINISAWKTAEKSITDRLVDAITAKPGRPSFKITIKEQR